MKKEVCFLLFILFVIFGCTNEKKDDFIYKNHNTQYLGSKLDLNSLSFADSTKRDQIRRAGYYAEIVVIGDSEFINDIENLIKDNKCLNRRADLVLDYTNGTEFSLLRQTSLRNSVHLYEKENKNIYVTFLNNNLFFILFKEDDKLNLPIRKTGYKVDLTEYLSNYILVAHHLSYWYLREKKDGGAEVIKEVLTGCGE